MFVLSFRKLINMASNKITKKGNVVDKEKLVKSITDKLQISLPGLKEHFSEKKFEKKIAKAAEILVRGIKVTPTKKVIADKKKINKTKSKD